MGLLISREGLNAKQKQLADLQQRLIESQNFKGSIAIHSGDAWHDNNDFEQCEIEERRLLHQIRILEEEIFSATVVEEVSGNRTTVNYGAKVSLKLVQNGRELPTYTVLFSDSDEPAEFRKVSANSPLGAAIYKKREGDTGNYKVNSNEFTVTILKIEY